MLKKKKKVNRCMQCQQRMMLKSGQDLNSSLDVTYLFLCVVLFK